MFSGRTRHAALVVSDDGRLFAFTTVNNEMLVCDGVTAALQQRIRAHSGTICSLAISRDGQLPASSDDDLRICIRRAADGPLLRELTGPAGVAVPMVFLPDGTRGAAGSRDSTGRLWETPTAGCRRRLSGACAAAVGCRPLRFLLTVNGLSPERPAADCTAGT